MCIFYGGSTKLFLCLPLPACELAHSLNGCWVANILQYCFRSVDIFSEAFVLGVFVVAAVVFRLGTHIILRECMHAFSFSSYATFI